MTRRNPRQDPRAGDHLASHGYPRHVYRVDSEGVRYVGGNGREALTTLDEWREWREWAAGAEVVRRPKPQPGTVAAWNHSADLLCCPILPDGTIWLRGHLDHGRARLLATLEATADEPHDWPATEWHAGPVEHAHARKVPSLDEQGDRCTAVVLSAPGRGAFPVTIITLERR